MTERIGTAGNAAERESAADRHREVFGNYRVRLDTDVVRSEVFRARLEIADAVSVNPERVYNLRTEQIGIAERQRIRCDVGTFRLRGKNVVRREVKRRHLFDAAQQVAREERLLRAQLIVDSNRDLKIVVSAQGLFPAFLSSLFKGFSRRLN